LLKTAFDGNYKRCVLVENNVGMTNELYMNIFSGSGFVFKIQKWGPLAQKRQYNN
jgi:hypothetical protein